MRKLFPFILLLMMTVNMFAAADIIPDFDKKYKKPNPNIDRKIIPNKQVGPVNTKSSKADLEKEFGMNNILDSSIKIKGKEYSSTKVYFGKDDEISIVWQDKSMTKPWKVIIHQNSKWETEEGLKIGLSIAELAKINETAFMLDIDNDSYRIKSSNWGQGKIAENVEIVFNYEKADRNNLRSLFNQSQEVLSNSKLIDQKNFIAETIIFTW